MKQFFLFSFFVFSTLVNAQFTKLFDLTSATGGHSHGDLVSDGTFLYGITFSGGANGDGSIYKIRPDGTGFAQIFDFEGISTGSTPRCSLFFDGTFLYGTTSSGPGTSSGHLFKIKPDGTGFASLYGFGQDGAVPYSSVISDGTYLYGTTHDGGAFHYGIIYKIKPDGTGYSKLFDFDVSNGANPNSALMFDGTFLYGMTSGGGTDNWGVIYKIKPDGTGYTVLMDFDVSAPATGLRPYGSLISDGTFLYGMANYGGANSRGTVFRIKPDGTGYTVLYDFIGQTAGDGSAPVGSLISDGTFMYGMTSEGGTGNCFQMNGCGTIFKIKPDGSGYAKLFDFDDINGKNAVGSLILNGNFLYGTAKEGGTGSYGTVFKYQLAGTGIAENDGGAGFVISPNPTKGKFTVALSGGQNKMPGENISVNINNVLGEKTYSSGMPANSTTFDISGSPKGVYFVEILSGNQRSVKKIILE